MTRRQLAILAHVARAVLDEIAAAGGPVGDGHRRALALADEIIAGGKLSKAKLRAAMTEAHAESSRFGVSSPRLEHAVYWLGGPIVKLCSMLQTGKELSEQVLTEAGYAVPIEGDYFARKKHLDALQAAAIAACAEVPDDPLLPPPERKNPKRVAAERAALEVSLSALAPLGASLLERMGAARDLKQLGGRSKLASLAKRLRYRAHEEVLRFEEQFGGLLIPSMRDDSWRAENLFTLVGPWTCLKNVGAQPPRGGASNAADLLVPVALGPNEDVYFLDAKGQGWFHDSLGELEAVRYCPDGATLVLLLALQAVLFFGVIPAEGHLSEKTEQAREIARQLDLPAVASGPTFTWWASEEAVVLQSTGTRAVALSKAAAVKLADIQSRQL